jgi:hypothetical protein
MYKKLQDLLLVQKFRESIGHLRIALWIREFECAGCEVTVSLEERRFNDWHTTPDSFQIRLRREINYKARSSTYKIAKDGSFNEKAFLKKLAEYIKELSEYLAEWAECKKKAETQLNKLVALAGEEFIPTSTEELSVEGTIKKISVEVQQSKKEAPTRYTATLSNLSVHQFKSILEFLRAL